MANRAERRRTERQQAKAIKSRGGPPPVDKPAGDHGVLVEGSDEGYVYLTFFGGYSTFVVKWTVEDAKIVNSMIEKACEGRDAVGKGYEVVRESGLVVAKDVPQ